MSAASIGEEQFLSSPKQELLRKQERRFFQLIAKRLAGFPLSYLTGSKEFWSISFKVFPDVCIPRPETELLVENAVGLSSRKEETIVDIGTGCGNIAVSLAKELPKACIIATDISERALKAARLNASEQKVRNITFARGDLLLPLEKLNLKGKCDFIVSNPPYVSEKEWIGLSAEIKNHEPKKALVAGETGLEFIEKIIKGTPPFLRPGGFLILELGEGQRDEVVSFFNTRWKEVNSFQDLNGIPRVIIGEKR